LLSTGFPSINFRKSFDLSSADQEDISNELNIALQDIKSIEVLKDAASTAIYGSRGADGVLLIETYKGRLGKVQFDYTYKGSLNVQPKAIPMLNGDEYIMLQLEEWHNRYGIFQIPSEIAYDKDYAGFYNYSQNVNWIDEVTKLGRTHDHYFNISGGGDKTRYFTSFSYVDEGGTTISTGAKNFSSRVNLDYFLSKKTLFSIQFSYSNNNVDGNMELDDGSGWRRRNVREMAYIKAPNMSIWEYDAFGRKTGEYFTPITSYQGNGSQYYNPIAVANLGENNRRENLLQNNFTLSYNLTPWLTFRETLSFQFIGRKEMNYLPYNAIGTDWLEWTVNKAEESNNQETYINTESQLAFEAPFADSSNHVLTGAMTWITNSGSGEWMNLQSNKIPSTDIKDPAVNGQINWLGDGSWESRGVGALVNLNYKFKDRYLITGILRADAYSSFGANHRWGLFKGVSAGWRFSEEPIFSNLTWLDESKLYVSWGISGRQPSDQYARFATYTSDANYLNYPGIYNNQIQLDNLQWESIEQYDIGLELNLFNDRLYFEGDIYQKITTNLLFSDYKLPTSSGFDQLEYLNAGELENRGWEVMFDYKIIRKEDLRLSFNF
jgi:TonB-linked SusC/RagA family outer membrane protein